MVDKKKSVTQVMTLNETDIKVLQSLVENELVNTTFGLDPEDLLDREETEEGRQNLVKEYKSLIKLSRRLDIISGPHLQYYKDMIKTLEGKLNDR